MKNSFYTLLIVLIAQGSFAADKKAGVLFTVRNPIAVPRAAETVSLDLRGLYLHNPEWRNEKLSVYQAKTELVSQTIDNDQDGVDDELIFQTSFKANETVQFEVYRKSSKPPHASVVDVRYELPREDVAWENDRIAFRVYGSPLAGNVDNGIDVWTKRVRYPIVAKWYKESEGSLPGKDTYHQDRGEGADFFSVGKSLGAGSAGILWNGTLMQPGLFSHHRVIANGPIRVSVELVYNNLRLDSSRYTVIKRITLDAGQQLNRMEEVYISNAPHTSLILAGGLVKRLFTTVQRDSMSRSLSLWGPVNADSVNGSLGTALVFPNTAAVSYWDDTQHVGIGMEIPKGKKVTYYSGAAWSRMGDIVSEKNWVDYLKAFGTLLDHPLIITFKH